MFAEAVVKATQRKRGSPACCMMSSLSILIYGSHGSRHGPGFEQFLKVDPFRFIHAIWQNFSDAIFFNIWEKWNIWAFWDLISNPYVKLTYSNIVQSFVTLFKSFFVLIYCQKLNFWEIKISKNSVKLSEFQKGALFCFDTCGCKTQISQVHQDIWNVRQVFS